MLSPNEQLDIRFYMTIDLSLGIPIPQCYNEESSVAPISYSSFEVTSLKCLDCQTKMWAPRKKMFLMNPGTQKKFLSVSIPVCMYVCMRALIFGVNETDFIFDCWTK